MAGKWVKTTFPGVRYKEHPTRKNGVKRDQYFTIRYKLAGKDREEGLGWASENWTAAKAYDRLKELKENRKTGEGPQTLAEKRAIEDKRKDADKQARQLAEKENVTFGRFMAETYLPQCKRDKKPTTYAMEEALYRVHLAETIGNLPFGKIAAFHVERVKKAMADKKKAGRTIQYALQVTRQVFNMARKRGVYTGENPTSAVKWPKLDNMKMRYLSIDEAEKLFDALAAKSHNLHDMALLSLHSGLRFGEIAKLTWSCVNWKAGTLAILDAKTGSRTAYLTTRAKAMLKNREEGAPNELIFQKRSGLDGSIARASKTFSRVVKELGLNQGITDRKQKVTFHTLRHSYATHLYESTHDLYLTQKSLGHTTSTMTQRYAKMTENRLREGSAALEAAFKTNGQKKKKNAGQVL
ncbi:tyrosine-type recombinase/integrase [Desulfosudis oleivorans]|uniref:Integrase family protein n=1 Tax=Desulfosudis oleivorans (strain DSM 6200 / JCM 39069 / Hxd3) TaxID=96561 RepID=A8ZYY4_DESOH|nr:site-specific integrase [Desulfosudis oleivorans]ABW68757.1 integrase family protein [Desulfosudis oleivorans Hxd3]